MDEPRCQWSGAPQQRFAVAAQVQYSSNCEEMTSTFAKTKRDGCEWFARVPERNELSCTFTLDIFWRRELRSFNDARRELLKSLARMV